MFDVKTAGDDFDAWQQGQALSESDELEPGLFVTELVTDQIFFDDADLVDAVSAWAELAEEQDGFRGRVVGVYVQTLPIPAVELRRVWMVVEVAPGDLPELPPGAAAASAFPFLAVALLTAAILAAASFVFAVGVTVEPQGWRKFAATVGLGFDPDNDELKKVLGEPDEQGIGDRVASSLPILSALGIIYLVTK